MVEIRLGCLRDAPVRGKVQVDIRLPVGVACRCNAAKHVAPGVRCDDVDAAELLCCPDHERARRDAIGQIDLFIERLSPLRTDLRKHLLHTSAVRIVEAAACKCRSQRGPAPAQCPRRSRCSRR